MARAGQDPAPGLRWRGGCHELEPHQHGLKCARCSLTCAVARREAVSRARCSTWALVGADGVEVVEARGFAAWNAALPVRFALAAGAGATKGSKRAGPVEGHRLISSGFSSHPFFHPTDLIRTDLIRFFIRLISSD